MPCNQFKVKSKQSKFIADKNAVLRLIGNNAPKNMYTNQSTKGIA